MTLAFDIALAGLLLAIAAWTILARQTFTAVLVFIVYGLLLSLVWVRLSAVDIALTEAAIGSGVTGMLLLSAAARLHAKDGADTCQRPAPPWRGSALHAGFSGPGAHSPSSP